MAMPTSIPIVALVFITVDEPRVPVTMPLMLFVVLALVLVLLAIERTTKKPDAVRVITYYDKVTKLTGRMRRNLGSGISVPTQNTTHTQMNPKSR